jgi:hypothetical protein
MASYHRGTKTNGVQRSKDLTVISQEIVDPTPSTYPVDWCETWGFRWKDLVENERITLRIHLRKGKASKPMCHYLCSPRFLGLAL